MDQSREISWAEQIMVTTTPILKGKLPRNIFDGRVLREETRNFYLFEPDASSLPNYLSLEPKGLKSRRLWVVNLLNFLDDSPDNKPWQEGVQEGQNQPAKAEDVINQIGHSNAYFYKNGWIRFNVDLQRVEIEAEHPNRDEVIKDFLRIY